MAGRVDFEFGFGAGNSGKKPNASGGYRIYLLGKFSGRMGAWRSEQKIRGIDVDHFEQVMAAINPSLPIDASIQLEFKSLGDFHPDALLQKIPLLVDLLALKRQLNDPNCAEQAAARIRAYLPGEISTANEMPDEAGESQDEMFERLLGRKMQTLASKPQGVDRLVEALVAPHVAKAADPQYQTLVSVIELTVNQYLVALLQHPDFRELESLWRALAGVLNEESADLQRIFLLDIDQTILAAELGSGEAFQQYLLDHIALGDGEQRVLLLGAYHFNDTPADLNLLVQCSRLAAACQAQFITGADHALLAHAVFGQAEGGVQWRRYLQGLEADKVMMAYPDYLSRLPYGAKREPVESMAFEECPGEPITDSLLWENSAFLLARALMRADAMAGAENVLLFDDLPCFAFQQDGETLLQPGAERVLTEGQANDVLQQGIVPVIGFRQRQGVRLLGLSSVSTAL